MDSIINQIFFLAPMAIVVFASLLVLIIEATWKQGERISYLVTLLGLAGAIVLSAAWSVPSAVLFDGMVRAGGSSTYFTMLFAAAAFLTVLLSRPYMIRFNILHGEYYALILFATVGMMLMASAGDLITLFLGIEVMSISLYILAGFMRKNIASNEAAMKYFLLGAFATGFLLYGIALIYGATCSTNLEQLIERFPVASSSYLFWSGAGLLVVALGFKVAAVPFHMWAPDVYEGSPTTVAGFMSTGSKAAAFSALMIVFGYGAMHSARLADVFALLAAGSMIIGNVAALSQTSVKRMLAYSSIAHAGYILAGVAAGSALGWDGVIFYLTVYTFTNIGAFGVLSLIESAEGKYLLFEDSAGLSGKQPLLAAFMAIFMFSLTGIPPFAGFFAKYYVFAAAVQADMTWLAVIGVLSSLVSVYYYLRIVVLMYFRSGAHDQMEDLPRVGMATLAISVIATIVFGVFPSSILSLLSSFR